MSLPHLEPFKSCPTPILQSPHSSPGIKAPLQSGSNFLFLSHFPLFLYNVAVCMDSPLQSTQPPLKKLYAFFFPHYFLKLCLPSVFLARPWVLVWILEYTVWHYYLFCKCMRLQAQCEQEFCIFYHFLAQCLVRNSLNHYWLITQWLLQFPASDDLKCHLEILYLVRYQKPQLYLLISLQVSLRKN